MDRVSRITQDDKAFTDILAGAHQPQWVGRAFTYLDPTAQLLTKTLLRPCKEGLVIQAHNFCRIISGNRPDQATTFPRVWQHGKGAGIGQALKGPPLVC